MHTEKYRYYFVYKTTNLINNKIYIGKHSTTNLNDGYLGSGKALKLAIKKYGKDMFKIEILKFFNNDDESSNYERELVNEDFILRNDTYNIILGGSRSAHTINISMSDDTKQKISKTLTGYKHTEDAKINMKKSHHIGFKHTETSKKLMSEKLSGRIVSDTTKIKMSISRKGRKLSTETKNKLKGKVAHNKGIPCSDIQKENISNTLKEKNRNGGITINRYKRKIVQLTLDGEFIKLWDSIKEAQESLNLHGVSSCCSGRLKTCGNFKWEYVKENVL